MADSSISIMRLLQLASATLPVGAYSYSQGLEHAVEAAIVHDEHSAQAWIEDAMHLNLALFDLPAHTAMLDAASRSDLSQMQALNADFLAGRETAELRAESVQMGHSLRDLLCQLGDSGPALGLLRAVREPAYPCAFACAAVAFGLSHEQGGAAYIWSWLEGQVMAAIKLVPLGHSAGQRVLLRLSAAAASLAAQPRPLDSEWFNFAPGLALASTAHETQYSRLFRS